MTSRKDFLEKLTEFTKTSRIRGKNLAINRLAKILGLSKERSEETYSRIKAGLKNTSLFLNMPIESLLPFLTGSQPPRILPSWDADRFERVLGCYGLGAHYAVASCSEAGAKDRASQAVMLGVTPADCFILAGTPVRLWDASREDFITEVSDLFYAVEDLNDARTVMACFSVQASDMSSPNQMFERISNQTDVVDVMVFSNLNPTMVSMVIVDGEESEVRVRKTLESIGKILPVKVVDRTSTKPEVNLVPEQILPQASSEFRYFQVGDKVATKPAASMIAASGIITSIANGAVRVEWENKTSSIMSSAEALMKLMWKPKEQYKLEVFDLPSMDSQTIKALASCGLDPVAIQSIASHTAPLSNNQSGWVENLVSGLKSFGLTAERVNGYRLKEGVFAQASWIEARLPKEKRLVIDIEPQGIVIAAGDPSNYVLPSVVPVAE